VSASAAPVRSRASEDTAWRPAGTQGEIADVVPAKAREDRGECRERDKQTHGGRGKQPGLGRRGFIVTSGSSVATLGSCDGPCFEEGPSANGALVGQIALRRPAAARHAGMS